jgi:copper chaperone CopZ
MKNLIKALILTAALFAAPISQAAETVEIGVNGLVCGFCAQGVNKQLRKHDATEDVLVSLEHKLVAVQLAAGKTLTDAEVRAALTDAGYTVTSIDRTNNSLEQIRTRLGIKK